MGKLGFISEDHCGILGNTRTISGKAQSTESPPVKTSSDILRQDWIEAKTLHEINSIFMKVSMDCNLEASRCCKNPYRLIVI